MALPLGYFLYQIYLTVTYSRYLDIKYTIEHIRPLFEKYSKKPFDVILSNNQQKQEFARVIHHSIKDNKKYQRKYIGFMNYYHTKRFIGTVVPIASGIGFVLFWLSYISLSKSKFVFDFSFTIERICLFLIFLKILILISIMLVIDSRDRIEIEMKYYFRYSLNVMQSDIEKYVIILLRREGHLKTNGQTTSPNKGENRKPKDTNEDDVAGEKEVTDEISPVEDLAGEDAEAVDDGVKKNVTEEADSEEIDTEPI